MRKEEYDSQPFEEIVDERGRRYMSGADLVRPEKEKGPRRVPTALLIWIGVVLIIGAIIVVPIMDRQSMRQPVVDLVSALNGRDINRMRGCFTADAKIGTGENQWPAGVVLSAVEPYIGQYGNEGDLKFYKLEKVSQLGHNQFDVDFQVVYHLEGVGDESTPMGRIPIYKNGHVILRRLGWFRWKIAGLSSDEQEFSEAISGAMQGMILRGLVPGVQ